MDELLHLPVFNSFYYMPLKYFVCVGLFNFNHTCKIMYTSRFYTPLDLQWVQIIRIRMHL